MSNKTLPGLTAAAADKIALVGWTQGEMESEDGKVCLTGAIRACSPRPGDWMIARAVLCKIGRAETWNDANDRTESEVLEFLRSSEITDEMIADTFGPQWEAVVSLIRQAATLTHHQVERLREVYRTARDAAWSEAWSAAWGAARGEAWSTAWGAAWDTAWSAAWGAAWDAARGAAWDAARALAVADLVGQHGLTQQHIDTLMTPWISVMGDPRIPIAQDAHPHPGGVR